MEIEGQTEINTQGEKGHIKIDWGRQGGVIAGYIVVLLGYYGIIANLVMFNQWGKWLSFLELPLFSNYGKIPSGTIHFFPGRDIFFWSYNTYIATFFLPALILFLICFLMTYKEDIPHYGIKASLWLAPLIIIEGFILHSIMFGFSSEPFYLKFMRIEGYIDIITIFGLALSGAISGMKVKQYREKRKNF
ncbi:hypothetical protein LCGC14_0636870 [marine sediment metagenome]|uniref:Uncharacterized protein n=1 Tax=marine sediment metagenome TaxID=412755 RepID=A0A0F9TLT0_9ZZZZ|nr:MAG: hypothetical protein Lokiarch_08460 [Candidatus Lokiarchaeum sp. GC14_75]HEC39063.1 hypothetical protein [bacterium]